MLGFTNKARCEDRLEGPLRLPSLQFQEPLWDPRKASNHLLEIADKISGQVALRHPHARHNEIGIFNGSPDKKEKYGLTAKGRIEAAALVPLISRWVENSGKPLLIVHSDFKRTREMADILVRALGDKVLSREERKELRERDPGSLEGLNYRGILRKFGIQAREEEHERFCRSALKRSLIELIHRGNILAAPCRQAFNIEPLRNVEERTTRLIKELHNRQLEKPQLVLLIGHEFCLGPALNAFLKRPAALFWTNRHIPRAKPFTLSTISAQRHFLKQTSMQPLPNTEL